MADHLKPAESGTRMTTDYTKLDAAIIASLHPNQPKRFSALSTCHAVAAEAIDLSNAHGAKNRYTRKDPFRFVDARIQALKKAGKIKFQGATNVSEGGWLRVE